MCFITYRISFCWVVIWSICSACPWIHTAEEAHEELEIYTQLKSYDLIETTECGGISCLTGCWGRWEDRAVWHSSVTQMSRLGRCSAWHNNYKQGNTHWGCATSVIWWILKSLEKLPRQLAETQTLDFKGGKFDFLQECPLQNPLGDFHERLCQSRTGWSWKTIYSVHKSHPFQCSV